MSTQFAFSEYLDSVTRAFDLARNSYRLILVVCAALIVFAIQGEPYKGSKKYLNHLMQAKAEIDEESGWIKGIEVVRAATNEPALSEPIGEAESRKRKIMARLYAELQGTPDEVEKIKKQLEEEALTEKQVSDALSSELAKQYQFGVAAGLKVPLLDIVVERERVPALFSVLVAIFAFLTSISIVNLKHALQLFLQEASEAGLAKKASDLLSMRGLAMLLPRGGVNEGLQSVLLSALHLLPSLLVAYAVAGAWSASATPAKVVYCTGFLVTLTASSICVRSWIFIIRIASQAKSTVAAQGVP